MTGHLGSARETIVDSRQFRRHVVRISHVGVGLLGSGFFVAPGWVLTAAHVVHDYDAGTGLPTVDVTPASPDVGQIPVEADVVARSEPPTHTQLWPFPDLALLRLHPTASWVDTHPCAFLASGDPLGDDCHAFGFAVREEDVDPPGGPARFTFEGVEGDGFLRLKAGQAGPGLSGAPLLCPARRAVIGVITASRNTATELGGWAAPIAALSGLLSGVPPELALHGRDVMERNVEAVLANRGQWHDVLPIPHAEKSLATPWEAFERQPGSLPAEMLLADSGVVPYLFRDGDLDHAERWCEQPSAMEVWRFSGIGGAGKTRHAIELCKLMSRRRWLVGLWGDPATHGASDVDIALVPLPRLIVVDYVEAIAADTLRVLLDRLRVHATQLTPVRVVLLSRNTAAGSDVLREIGKDAGAALRTVLNSSEDQVAIRILAPDERRMLYEAAFRAFQRDWDPEQVSVDVEVPDLAGDRYELPLEVLFEAFDRALSDEPTDPERMPIDRALDHEQRHWKGPAALPSDLRRAVVSLATLAGADTDDEAHALLSTLPELAGDANAKLRRETIAWLASLYGGSAKINPLRPDRLGEALVVQVLDEQHDQGRAQLRAALTLNCASQVARTLDLLARLATSNASVAETVAQALFDTHLSVVDLAETAAHATADRPGRLDVAIGLQRLLAGEFAARVENLAWADPNSEPAILHLSMSYSKIGDLARQSGQSERAESLYLKCLRIRERLSWAHPEDTSLARELSVAYIKLGDLAKQSAESARAGSLYDKGLAIREDLWRRQPGNGNYARDLAVAYDRRAALAWDTGQGQRTRRLYGQGLELREKLAKSEPDNMTFARDLSISYENLGDLARDARRFGEAGRLFEQGLEIREKLVKGDPENATYARDLSNTYDRLGDLARETDRVEAKRRYEQSMRIRRRLLDGEPQNTTFARDVSVSHSKLGDVASESRDFDEAERLYRAGLAIVAGLLRAEPRNTTFARDVSVLYATLGELAAERGLSDEAEELYKQGYDGARQLLVAEPENTTFARDVALFCERLGELARSGAASRAETLFATACDLRRTLHMREPTRIDLAEEFAMSLTLLAASAGAPVAGAAIIEAIDVLEPIERSGLITQDGLRILTEARGTPFGDGSDDTPSA